MGNQLEDIITTIYAQLQELLEDSSIVLKSTAYASSIKIGYKKNTFWLGTIFISQDSPTWADSEFCAYSVDLQMYGEPQLWLADLKASYTYDNATQRFSSGDAQRLVSRIKEHVALMEEARSREEEVNSKALRLREGYVDQARQVLMESGYTITSNNQNTRIVIKRDKTPTSLNLNLETGVVSRPKKTEMPHPLVLHLNEEGLFCSPVSSQPYIAVTVDKLVEVVQIVEKLQEVIDR